MTAEDHGLRSRSFTSAMPLPGSIETEQAVLGTLLLNNHTLSTIAAHIDPQSFQEPIHQAIFDVASTLIGEGQAATPATLTPFLGGHQFAENITVPAYLARLCAEAAPPVLAAGNAQLLRGLAARRDLVFVAAQLDERARAADVHDDPAEIAGSFMLEFQRIAGRASTDTTRHVSAHADDLMRLIEGVRSGEIESRVVTTGYPDLDGAMNGLVPGELIAVAGRPGMGKTAKMNSIAWRTARAGNGVLEFPLEIGHEQLVARHLADAAYHGPGSPAFRDIGRRAAQLSESGLISLRDAHRKLRELPIEIDRRSRVTVAQISAKVAQTKRSMAARGETLRVCLVDHLDYVLATDATLEIERKKSAKFASG